MEGSLGRPSRRQRASAYDWRSGSGNSLASAGVPNVSGGSTNNLQANSANGPPSSSDDDEPLASSRRCGPPSASNSVTAGSAGSGGGHSGPTVASYAQGIANILAGYSSASSYRTGSDTEEATTTDNPTTPFPTPPPTCASPTIYHRPAVGSSGMNPLHSPGLGGHRQASPYPIESINLSGNTTPVNAQPGSRYGTGGSSSGRHYAKKSSTANNTSSGGSSIGAGSGGGGTGTLGSRGRLSAASRRHHHQQQQHQQQQLQQQQQQQLQQQHQQQLSQASTPTSGSDNNSDPTYPDALRIDTDMGEESPPEPAPPEVPPRGPSLLHPTLRGVAAAAAAAAAAAEGVDYHTAAGGIPGTGAPTGLYVGTEYVMSGASPRPYAAKSPMGVGSAASSLHSTKDFLAGELPSPKTGSHLRLGGSVGGGSAVSGSSLAAAAAMAAGGVLPTNTSKSTTSKVLAEANAAAPPMLMPVFPLRPSAGSASAAAAAVAGHHHHHGVASPYSAYSPSRFHIDKRCQHRCTWKCCSIGLILLCVALTAMLAYFGAVSSMRPSMEQSCVVVEDAKAVADADDAKDATSSQAPTEVESLPTSTAVLANKGGSGGSSTPLASSSSDQAGMEGHLDQASDGIEGGDSPGGAGGLGTGANGAHGGVGLVGGLDALDISAHRHPAWPAVVEMHELGVPHAATIPPFQFWNAEFRNKEPSFIRLNFTLPWGANFAVYGRRNVAPSVTQYDFAEFVKGGRVDHRIRRSVAIPAPSYIVAHDHLVRTPEEADGRRGRRSASQMPMRVNVTLLQYLDTGRWFLSVYNDDLRSHQVILVVAEAEGVSTACPNDCSGHGSCYIGKCDCIDGYEGIDCSKSVCPVLCSNHGYYGGGVCHCEEGWKGPECDVPHHDCQVADCNGHGRCLAGTCVCLPGFKGNFCQEVDCPDPNCSGHGSCVLGKCYCKAGWQGGNCSVLDQQVYQCLPGCSDHGTYDLETASCICEHDWTGPDCSQALCSLDCGEHGRCDKGRCVCDAGWTGDRCDLLPCDHRCGEHGQCKNGTCVCSQGWNGRHCTLPGCMNGCSRNGLCSLQDGEYRCVCNSGWAGLDCSIQLELECNDEIDNDEDGMVDCSDSECCTHPACSENIMCLASNDPVEVLLRKQPPSVTASFYQRVKFLIEENSVQSYAHTDLYSESRVAVMRGQVVTSQGLGIVGIRVSVDRDSRFGFTLTRAGGWFDVLVNGGGAITLQFQRNPFRPLTKTVFVPWNQIVVLPPIAMQLSEDAYRESSAPPHNIANGLLGLTPPIFLAALEHDSIIQALDREPCMAHDDERVKPIIVSTWQPEKVGGKPGNSLVLAETQIVQESIRIPGSGLHLMYQSSQSAGYLSTILMRLTHDHVPQELTHVHVRVEIEGAVHSKTYEADPQLSHTFAWNKRNVYKQKVYGVAQAKISVGYQYSSCRQVVWETQTAKLQGFDVEISDVGGWGLDIHHHYNFHEGILQKGDGSTLHLKQYPRTVQVVMGTGLQRSLVCPDCNGSARDARLLTPVALASGPDGSLYVGDFNLVRRVTPSGSVVTVLELSATQVSYQYYLSVSPADGHLYVSNPEKHQILRVSSLEEVHEPAINWEAVVGSGERCIPGDESQCGDEGPAMDAKLAHPKGLAIAADKTMYIADGTNIRAVDPKGIIHTLVGHHGHHNHWAPIPCSGAIPATQAQLQWPTGLALSPLDGSLHFVDDRLILKLTDDLKVKVVAGTPLHCHVSPSDPRGAGLMKSPGMVPGVSILGHIGPGGTITGNVVTGLSGQIPTVTTTSGPGLSPKPDEDGFKATGTVLGSILALAFSPSGDLFLAESDSRKINAIRIVDSAGRIADFAGRQPEAYRSSNCDCSSSANNGSGCACADGENLNGGVGGGTNTGGVSSGVGSSSANGNGGNGNGGVNGAAATGQHAGKETLLAWNAQFSSISALTVSPDGVLHVADQGSLHILALQHYLPTHDENGEFRIPYPATGEIYVFNRYGQHTETRDLTSGKTLYTFLYSKNTSFGKLSTVADASGNKVIFRRDYSNVVSTIENSQDHKTDLKISAVGYLVRFSEKGESDIELEYDSATGLLTSRSDARGGRGGETYIYSYDGQGRVKSVVLATGETLTLSPRLTPDDSLAVNVQVPVQALLTASTVADPSPRHQHRALALKMDGHGSRRLSIREGVATAEAVSHRNGTFSVVSAWGSRVQCAALSRHPLLELALPVEAEMLPMWSHQGWTLGEGLVNTMHWRFALVGDVRGETQTLRKEIWVNGSRIMGIEYDQSIGRQTYTDRDRTPILAVNYDHSGLPRSWIPLMGHAPAVNVTYDRFNRVDGWSWGERAEQYSYDAKGLLSEVVSPIDGATKFQYNDVNMLSSIILPSGRQFNLQYDDSGGLRHVILPAGTRHSFSCQPSLGFVRVTYTPPGSTRAYLQHYSHSGALLLTAYPEGPRVVFRHHPTGQLAEVIHGDGRTLINYAASTTFPSEVLHTEGVFEYRWDYQYIAGLLTEERLDFGAKTGLSNAKFTYEYDTNFRLIAVQGRIGGQSLPEHQLGYCPRTGAPEVIGQFRVTRNGPNETSVHDGTAIFSRITNGYFQDIQVSVTIHRMEVFRMEFAYDGRGRVSQTRTYTRNVGVNTYTTVKNYTWDADGQLTGVEAQEPWGFRYDPNGNMLSLTYRGNTIPMEYNIMDRIQKFGEGLYKYDGRGLVIQNAREERFHYNAKGLLVRAIKRGRFDVRYFYDHLDRLATRKDNYGNVTQFFYTNQHRPNEVSQIYSPRDGKLMTLVYDERGHVMFAQVYRHKYYVATDQCGTPVMVFNQYGEGIREIMRSPYGHIVYDSNPYLYLPVDFCGGLLDQVTSLVHMPGGKVYDPLIGQWMTPSWQGVLDRVSDPARLHLYRFNGNDPINVRRRDPQLTDDESWLTTLGYDLESIAPQLYPTRLATGLSDAAPLLEKVTSSKPALSNKRDTPFRVQAGFLARLSERRLSDAFSLASPPLSKVKRDAWPADNSLAQFSLRRLGAASEPPFGRGILVSRTSTGLAVVSSVPAANAIYRDVFTSVFNASYLLPFTFLDHNGQQDKFFFVKEESWRASEDRGQLKRLGGQINVTYHEKDESSTKVVDLKLHGTAAIINLRYGTTPEKERQRLLHHAKGQAVRKAWHRERDALKNSITTAVEWSQSEMDEIMKQGTATAWDGEYVHDVFRYPELAEDGYNVRFVKRPAGSGSGATSGNGATTPAASASGTNSGGGSGSRKRRQITTTTNISCRSLAWWVPWRDSC